MFMTVEAVYVPPEDHKLRDKERFYHKVNLMVMVGRFPAGNVLVVRGDLNAETGSDRVGSESCLGKKFSLPVFLIFHLNTANMSELFKM